MRFPAFRELRRSPRVSLDSEIVWVTGGKAPEEVLNLSLSGFALVGPSAARLGTERALTLALRDGTLKVDVTAEAVSQRRLARPGLQCVGYRFIEPTPFAQVRRLLAVAMQGKPGARPRLAFGVEAAWSWQAQSGPLELIDLGWSGTKVTGAALPPVGTTLMLSIPAGDAKQPVALPARVMSLREGGEGSIAELGFSSDRESGAVLGGLIEGLLFSQRAVPPPPPECPPGTRIGSFVVGELLTRGRMTEVYRAHLLDPSGNADRTNEFGMRRFAGPGANLEVWSDRFLEASQRGAALLDNPRVLQIFGATRDRTECWLATELHTGTSLDRVLAQCALERRLAPFNGVLSVMQEVLVALQDGQVVHGDLRPSNVLIGEAGEVKLVGFGNALEAGQRCPAFIPPDRVGAFPPELLGLRAESTVRSDLYQVGVMLYEGLTGALPFPADRLEALEALVAARPAPPSKLNPQVPAELDRVVLSALSLDPQQRPPNARELLLALRAVSARAVREVPGRPELLDRVSSVAPALQHRTDETPEHSGLVHAWKPATTSLEPGEHLGRYEVLGKVTKGGMAEVYLARSLVPGAAHPLVLLKTILPSESNRMESVRLFLNEARVAALLFHPHIVELYDFGFDKGRPYLVMEWVQGVNLAELMKELVKRELQLPPALAARIIAGCSAGLAHAHGLKDARGHSLDIVHRDVTAKNILVSYAGEVKVLDFGIARFRGSSQLTRAGNVRGTAAYLSPEQLGQQTLTGQADVWALGVNLYHLLTGATPFQRENFPKTVEAVMHHQQAPAHEVQPAVPV